MIFLFCKKREKSENSFEGATILKRRKNFGKAEERYEGNETRATQNFDWCGDKSRDICLALQMFLVIPGSISSNIISSSLYTFF
jgi:hypothetical protein